MNENKTDKYGFVAYEYKEIRTDNSKVSFLIDSYRNFGWEVDENIGMETVRKVSGAHSVQGIAGTVILRLKRDRKIINRMELTRLQRNFEFCLKNIEHLEKSRTSEATALALAVGIAGTVFMTFSVFSITLAEPNFLLCVMFAIPAFVGWILPYFIYNYKVNRKTVEIEGLIEEKEEEIFQICEKGSKLIYQ